MRTFSITGRIIAVLFSAQLMYACTGLHGSNNQANGTAQDSHPSPLATVPAPPSNPEDKMPRVKVDEARKLVEEGKAVIVDVRGTEAYKLGHIKGALDIPLAQIESGNYTGLPKDKRIIAYCT